MIIRELIYTDWKKICGVYQAAFAGEPWFESFTADEVWERILQLKYKRGVFGFVAIEDEKLIGANWYDRPTVAELEIERGKALTDFASSVRTAKNKYLSTVWERELIVDPDFQNRGIGTALRRHALNKLKEVRGFLVLTRMRDDNLKTLKIAARIGFANTGIAVASKQRPGIMNRYYFLVIPY